MAIQHIQTENPIVAMIAAAHDVALFQMSNTNERDKPFVYADTFKKTYLAIHEATRETPLGGGPRPPVA